MSSVTCVATSRPSNQAAVIQVLVDDAVAIAPVRSVHDVGGSGGVQHVRVGTIFGQVFDAGILEGCRSGIPFLIDLRLVAGNVIGMQGAESVTMELSEYP